MNLKIDIDTSTFIRFWLVLTGFTLALLAIYSARQAIVLLIVAFFLAMALNGPVNYIARYLPGKSRIMGTAISYVFIVLGLIVFIFLVVPPIIEETSRFIVTIPSLSDKMLTEWSGVGDFIERNNLQPHINSSIQSIQAKSSEWTANVGSNLIKGAGSLLSTVISAVIILVLAFLMLIEGPTWLDRFWKLYHDKTKMNHHRDLVKKMYSVVTGFVTGQLAIASIGGVVSGFAVFILSLTAGTPANLAIPTIAVTAILSLIPMFGATLAGVLVMILLAFSSTPAAMVYIIYFFIYQQIENNFIAPVVQSKTLQLSPLTILVSVTIGLYVFGLLGGLISIPIAGCIKVLLEDYFSDAHKTVFKNKKSPLGNALSKLQSKT